jgi:hypothetical protein
MSTLKNPETPAEQKAFLRTARPSGRGRTLGEQALDYARRDAERLAQHGQDWHGCLTLENLEAMAARIRDVLTGRLYTTMVELQEASNARLATSRFLTRVSYKPARPWQETGVTTCVSAGSDAISGKTMGFLDIHDQTSTWGFDTMAPSALAIADGSYALRRLDPYFSFSARGASPGCHVRGFAAEFRNYDNQLRRWSFALEDGVLPEDEDR